VKNSDSGIWAQSSGGRSERRKKRRESSFARSCSRRVDVVMGEYVRKYTKEQLIAVARGKGLYPKEGGNEEEVNTLRAEQRGLPQAGDEARPSERAA
jgi:hypothetical protein